MVELLSPVGDFECLKAAVQNGANAVYFGAKSFGARAFASNFDTDNLEKAIQYAKLRNVKTHLTLNTLIKENEFQEAFELAKTAYKFGIDAIIVQDIGLAQNLIKAFPDLDIHASTQMTIHNLEGVLELQKLGFKRAVLSRELSLEEIEHISKNTNMEIEAFIHGALCISYSGQCLLSSMVGGRSGNRGKCAQPCRLPYKLLEQNENEPTNLKLIDKGYLLSTRDLCSLEYLPKLIQAGVSSFKIEGRMKNPEYVATVTRLYRKYIDLAISDINNYIIDPKDLNDLMQVFNRGGFSSGHLSSNANRSLVFKEKPNNMGIYLGKILKYNSNKGHIVCKLENNAHLGDSVSFENENSKYLISELMENNKNIESAKSNQIVKIGRMKGNIKSGDRIYKISSKHLSEMAKISYSKENIKTPLSCKIQINKDKPINVEILSPQFNIHIQYTYDCDIKPSENQPLTKEKIITQFCKTQDTPFYFNEFDIDLNENVFIPISIINDIRRCGIIKIEQAIIKSFTKVPKSYALTQPMRNNKKEKTRISLLLNRLNLEFNYDSLLDIDKLYIPLKYFGDNNYSELLSFLAKNFKLYIYMPAILKKEYVVIAKSIIEKATSNFNITGIVISNLSQLQILPKSKYLDLVGNFNLNIYNSYCSSTLKKLNINTITISPELDEEGITDIGLNTSIPKELIVYGNIPVMTINYCPLGKSNKCYTDCKRKCLLNTRYFLTDRMGFNFRIIPDNTQTITTIYNSKTTSIEFDNFNIDFARIDILDETIDDINNIISNVKNGKRFEGKQYTNGNLKRPI